MWFIKQILMELIKHAFLYGQKKMNMPKTCQVFQKISCIIFSYSKLMLKEEWKEQVGSQVMAMLPLLICSHLFPARVFMCYCALLGIPSVPVVRAVS